MVSHLTITSRMSPPSDEPLRNSRPFGRPLGMLGKLLSLLTAAMGSGCVSWIPVHPLTPAVAESASRYSEVMANFSDQALLANILRAKDNMPLNFNDLSAISGSFSLSDTLGFTIPFGPLTGPANQGSTTYKNSATPSITGTSSPTITVGTLNTQGFMMTMIQPISTTYILSKWNSHPHELLLYLFIKSIRFPNESGPHRNNPDDDAAFTDFSSLVSDMIGTDGDVDLKSLMVLDPLGDPVPFGTTLQATTPMPSQTPSSTTPPDPPRLTDDLPGNLAPGYYYVRTTYVTNSGETLPSGESQFFVERDHGLIVKAPVNPPADQGAVKYLGYNIYIGAAPGSETKQNTVVTKFVDDYPRSAVLIRGQVLPNAPGTQYLVSSDYSIIQTIGGLNDGQLHAGNALCPQAVRTGAHAIDLCPEGSGAPFVQFYKEYPAQIVLCLKTGTDGLFKNHFIADMSRNEFAARSGLVAAEIKALNAQADLIGALWRRGLMSQAIRDQALASQSVVAEKVRNSRTVSQAEIFKAFADEVIANRALLDQGVLNKSLAGDSDADKAAVDALLVGMNTVSQAWQLSLLSDQFKVDNDLDSHNVVTDNSANAAAQALEDVGRIIVSVRDKTVEDDENTIKMMGVGKPQGTSPQSNSSGGGGGGAPAGGGGGGAAASAAGGGAMPQVTLALQPSRISAILHSDRCLADQIVLHTGTENQFETETKKFAHIEWRSIAEVIQYLGAIARKQDRMTVSSADATDTQKLAARDLAAVKITGGTQPLFTYGDFDSDTDMGEIRVTYRKKTYRAPLAGAVAQHDHTLESMAMINELISIAKISGSLPVPQPVTVLP
jgi:hypothetical protein